MEKTVMEVAAATEKGIFANRKEVVVPGKLRQIWNIITNKPAIPVEVKKLGLAEIERVYDGLPRDFVETSAKTVPVIIVAASNALDVKVTYPEEAKAKLKAIDVGISGVKRQTEIDTGLMDREIDKLKKKIEAIETQRSFAVKAAEGVIAIQKSWAGKASAMLDFFTFKVD